MRALLLYLALVVTLAGMGNFFWYISESLQFGGGALNGFVRDGHYYLALHGTYTEVSQMVWEHIRLHEVSVLLSVPFVALCGWYWLMGHAFPQVMGMRQGETIAERVHMVEASGQPLASRRCGGNIAGVGLGGPFLAVAVFPEGITIRLFPRQPVAILKDELTLVGEPKRYYNRIKFTHTSPDIVSPIVLYTMPWSNISELAGALDWLAANFEDRTGA